jgi:hypothetical protein
MRDDLDIAIYMLTASKKGAQADSLKLIEQISNKTVTLSQRMLEEINKMEQRELVK